MTEQRTHDTDSTADSPPSRSWYLPFLTLTALWLLATYAVSHTESMEILHVGATMLLFSVPICLAGIYTSTLRQEFRLALFKNRGWLYALLSRRLLRIMWWIAFSLAMSFFLLLQLQTYTRVEWAVLATVLPVFPITFGLFRRSFLKELRADVATSEALIWSRRTCPALMVVLYVLATAIWGDLPQPESFNAIYEAYVSNVNSWSGSALVQVGLSWSAYFDALKAYALGHLGDIDALWALFAMGVGSYAVCYTACLALSCFLVPRDGFVQARLVPRSSATTFMVAAVTTIGIGFIYFPGLASLDEYVSQRFLGPDPFVGATCELIDGSCYQVGTCAQIAAARAAVAVRVADAATRYRREVDAAFEELEDVAVEEYLDWYYSVSAEYVRIGMMLVGRLETHMETKFREIIQRDQWFQGVDNAFNEVLSTDSQARNYFEQTVREILDRNRVRLESGDSNTTPEADISEPTCDLDFIPPLPRWGVSGASSVVAGSISYIIIQKVLAKVLGKAVLKLGAKAAAGNIAGAGGALAGATIGSIVPGVGTAIGAVAGGIIVGGATAVGIDFALLKIDEAMSREEFKRELVAAIQEARDEIQADFFGQPRIPAPSDEVDAPGDNSDSREP